MRSVTQKGHPPEDFHRVAEALKKNPGGAANPRRAVGRVCAAPTVACPPAIPIAVSGEIITEEAVAALEHYGLTKVRTVKDRSKKPSPLGEGGSP